MLGGRVGEVAMAFGLEGSRAASRAASVGKPP
jgi:hypothetical protein